MTLILALFATTSFATPTVGDCTLANSNHIGTCIPTGATFEVCSFSATTGELFCSLALEATNGGWPAATVASDGPTAEFFVWGQTPEGEFCCAIEDDADEVTTITLVGTNDDDSLGLEDYMRGERLSARVGAPLAVAVHGLSGDDTMTGSSETSSNYSETLYGWDGDDVMWGRPSCWVLPGSDGVEYMYGGTGNDTMQGCEGDDHLYGETDVDTLYGMAGIDTLDGGTEGDTLYGGSDGDFLYGGDHDDVLHGDSGIDELYGEGGEDTLFGGSEDDLLYGGADRDRLDGGAGSDTVRGNDGADIVWGGTGLDFLHGNKGDDFLCDDGDDQDEFRGGFDEDTLWKGAGPDGWGAGSTGGPGADTCGNVNQHGNLPNGLTCTLVPATRPIQCDDFYAPIP